MLRGLIKAALVFRLEMRELPIDWGAVFFSWLRRPAIEITLPDRGRQEARRALVESLDTLYPF